MAENGNMRGGKPFAFGEHGAVDHMTLEQVQEMFGDNQQTPAILEQASALPQTGEIRRPVGSEEPQADNN